MYYIYYVPKIKVGCTTNIKKRLAAQGHKTYHVLYETDNIAEASIIERREQLKRKFKPDTNLYYFTTMNTYITPQTITFTGINSKNEFIKMLEETQGANITIGEDKIINDARFLAFAKNNTYDSQFDNMAPYMYTEKLRQYLGDEGFYSVPEPKCCNNNIFDNIRDWANKRDLISQGDSKTQIVKLLEESGELAKAQLKENKEEFIDAIGDIVVVLTNLAAINNLKIEDCIEAAYNEIKDRKGKMVDGTFKKD